MRGAAVQLAGVLAAPFGEALDGHLVHAALCYARSVSRRKVWEKVRGRFDAFRPADNPAWRADRPESPASMIIERLNMPFGDTRAMVLGTVGTGKSTELLRIAEARGQHDFVVILDLHRHFNEVVNEQQALHHVSAWEVAFLAGLAVLRAASEQLPYPIPESYVTDLSSAWEKAAHATETRRPQGGQVDAGAAAKAMIVAVSAALPMFGVPAATVTAPVKVLEAAVNAVRWSIPWASPPGPVEIRKWKCRRFSRR